MIDDFFRQGGASVFQITMHKNLNAYHRIEGVPNHASIHVKLDKEPSCVIFASWRYFSHILLDWSSKIPLFWVHAGKA